MMNVPILVTGVRVTLRKRRPAPEAAPSTETTSPGKGPWTWSKWQLLRGVARFVKVTVRDVEIDARDVGGGVVSARTLAVVGSAAAGREAGLVASVAVDQARCESVVPRDDTPVNVAAFAAAREGEGGDGDVAGVAADVAAKGDPAGGARPIAARFLRCRVDLTVRYASRDKRLVLANTDVDVAEADVETTGRWDGTPPRGHSDAAAEPSSKDADAAALESLRRLPSVATLRLGRLRVVRRPPPPVPSSPGSIRDAVSSPVVPEVHAKLASLFVKFQRDEVTAGSAAKGRASGAESRRLPRASTSMRWAGFELEAVTPEEAPISRRSACGHPAAVRCGAVTASVVLPLPPRAELSALEALEAAPVNQSLPAATARVNVSGLDACHHADTWRALRSCIASSHGSKAPTTPRRPGASPRWLWDAKVTVADGARLAVVGDDGAVCEAAATRTELSGESLGLTGRGGRRSPADGIESTPSAACAVAGFRLSFAARDDTSLRTVLRADGVGGNWKPRRRRGVDDGVDDGVAAVDLELKGATLDVACERAEALEASLASALASMKAAAASFLRKPADDAEGKADVAASAHVEAPRVALTMVDVRVIARAIMRPVVGPDLDRSERLIDVVAPTPAACAMELAVPLSQTTFRPRRAGGGWRLETSGWHLTYHDGVRSIQPGDDFGVLDATSSSRVLTATSVAVELSRLEEAEDRRPDGPQPVEDVGPRGVDEAVAVAINSDGVELRWHPDAHFFAQELAGTRARVLSSRAARRSEATDDASVLPAEGRKEARKVTRVALDLTRASLRADVTRGASVEVVVAALTSPRVTRGLALASPAVFLNGKRVMAADALDLAWGADANQTPTTRREGGVSHGEAPSVTSARRRYDVSVRRARLALPWGLDLGDALSAASAGFAALKAVGGVPFFPPGERRRTMSNDAETPEDAPSALVTTTLALTVVGSLTAEVFDSPLSRCLRGKATLLAPALASARVDEAAKNVSDPVAAYDARTAAYVRAAAAAASAASTAGASPADTDDDRRSTSHAAAMRASTGGMTITLVSMGGGAVRSTSDSAPCEAETAARRADAPWSDAVRLRVAHATTCHVAAEDVVVDLPLSPAPLFSARRLAVAGPIVFARQAVAAEPSEPTEMIPPLPFPVGARRYTTTRHPAAPPRPPLKLYTDLDVNLDDAGGCFATCAEPSLASALREVASRMSPPPGGRHEDSPGSIPGGRKAAAAKAAAATVEAAKNGWPEVSSPPPPLPWWDLLRSSWRGRARVTVRGASYVLDARGRVDPGELSRGPVGLEVGAAKLRFELTAGAVAVQAARLTLAARGGVEGEGDGVEGDGVDSRRATRNDEGVDALPRGAAVQLAVVPAAEGTFTCLWTTLGGDPGAGGQDHHRFDPLTGGESRPSHAGFSTGCRLGVSVTLSTKESLLSAWREKEEAAGEEKDKGTPPAPRRENNLASWRSGDFTERSSPVSPAMAVVVSAAAAAAVADAASTPTFIVGPAALRWLRRFASAFVSPPGALRSCWTRRPWGAPARARHPLAKGIARLMNDVDVTLRADDLRVVHPTAHAGDPARGLAVHASGLGCRATFMPAGEKEEAKDKKKAAGSLPPGFEPGARRRARLPAARVAGVLEVDLEEARVLLPPGDDETGGGGDGGGGDEASPSKGQLWGGVGSGNFRLEAERYQAVIEMLEGKGCGGSPGRSGTSVEDRGARLSTLPPGMRRSTATDPALVLETRFVRVRRRTDPPLSDADGRGGREGHAGTSTNTPSWLHVTVEAPRMLVAGRRRDVIVRWCKDAWAAAMKPEPPAHSLTDLRRLASAAAASSATQATSAASDAEGSSPAKTATARTDAKARGYAHRRSRSIHGMPVFDEERFDVVAGAMLEAPGADDSDDRAESAPFHPSLMSPPPPRRRHTHALSQTESQDLLALLLSEPSAEPSAATSATESVSGSVPNQRRSPNASDPGHRRSLSDLPSSTGTLPGADEGTNREATTRDPSTMTDPGASSGAGGDRQALKASGDETSTSMKDAAGNVPPEKSDADGAEEEQIVYVVDISAPQINLEGGNAAGRFLLAAVSGRVVGRRAGGGGEGERSWSRHVLGVRLVQVQAHVAPTDVDVNAGVQWLDERAFASVAGSEGSVGADDASYLLRQVFRPCAMELTFTTHCLDTSDTARGRTVPASHLGVSGYTHAAAVSAGAGSAAARLAGGGRVPRKGGAGQQPQALTEFALHSPEIEAELTAEQFEAFADVIASVFLAPLPDSPARPSLAAALLLRSRGRSLVEGEERASAAAVAGPLARFRLAQWSAAIFASDAADARVHAASAASLSPPGTFSETRERGADASEKIARAHARLTAAAAAAESAVKLAVSEAEALVKANRRRPAIKLSLSVGAFRWALRMSGRTFLVATISGLSLSRERHVDSSGLTKFILAELALDIPPPRVQGARSDEAWALAKDHWKPVLARWDPADQLAGASGARSSDGGAGVVGARGGGRKPLVRVHALRAPSPPEAPIWDHIEVSIQPFDLRVEREMYDRVISYVFPEKAHARHVERHAQFERQLIETRAEWARRHGKLSGNHHGQPRDAAETRRVSPKDEDPSTVGGGHSGTPSSALPRASAHSEAEARRILLGAGGASERDTGTRSRSGAIHNARHRRAGTWDKAAAGLHAALESISSHLPFHGAHADVGGGAAYAPLVSQDSVDRSTAGDAGREGADDDAGRAEATPQVAASAPVPNDPRVRKEVVVRYLRVNDVLLRVSYDGKPKSFHEVRLLLDASTAVGFRGRWRDLIKQLKGNIVWSVLKSITGLQGRRLPGFSSASGPRTPAGAKGHTGGDVRLTPGGDDARGGPPPTRVHVAEEPRGSSPRKSAHENASLGRLLGWDRSTSEDADAPPRLDRHLSAGALAAVAAADVDGVGDFDDDEGVVYARSAEGNVKGETAAKTLVSAAADVVGRKKSKSAFERIFSLGGKSSSSSSTAAKANKGGDGEIESDRERIVRASWGKKPR